MLLATAILSYAITFVPVGPARPIQPHDLEHVRECAVVDKVPMCVVLGTFAPNPQWQEALQQTPAPKPQTKRRKK